MLSLQHRLSLQQKLSPQQIQYQKLLQLNTLALEQRIKTELELNPILEETLDEEIDLEQLEETPDE
ncbi:MAG: RNA polymerase sigma-54 factor, partial [Ignavibacteria bacterium]|nr:RNA polymerase sigma-54 factor [Ignavibacteria bacterium]